LVETVKSEPSSNIEKLDDFVGAKRYRDGSIDVDAGYGYSQSPARFDIDSFLINETPSFVKPSNTDKYKTG
jgi:hypothetical protein